MLLASIALIVGLAVGGVGAFLVRWGRPAPTDLTGVTPDSTAARSPLTPGVVEVLDVLRSVTVVVDASDKVVRHSASAQALGLVRDSELAHAQLLSLVRQVRRDDDVREVELDVARGPLGQGRLTIGVRVAALSGQHVLLLIDDRTHSRRVEETRRDFVVNVSHELKTPVSGLTLLAEAMDDARDDPEAVHRFAGRMRTETSRLARLVQEIVELSRLQVADTLDEPVLVDVRACVKDAVDHLKVVADGKRIDLTTALGDLAVPAQVYGDSNLITTAIRNLAENAVAYSDPGTRVGITVLPDEDLVTIVVKDQGRGIPAADLERVFERFYRVDAARSRSTGGTGLGLAIVKHVCANHGGEVSVWSEEGQGSTFTIRLPAARPAIHQLAHPQDTSDESRKVTSS
ncbi:sensor histidine kinase [Rudaeicoccus suwonensis]|uniref:Sensor-like histidine kinase SenX3 n=1 Tax=Rudaeicoccus suwonensis TaxID=657409 RepID=A0A561E7N1_9MICO|nr:ATP-binding protein [Rudaeicoccus suwonensis]TWE11625.1 two-component system sensor histidine kinase SenX3 [Rudaeicoccus suwonensis]